MAEYASVARLSTTLTSIRTSRSPLLEPLNNHVDELSRKKFMGVKLRSKAHKSVIEVITNEDGELVQKRTNVFMRMGDVASMAVQLAKRFVEFLPQYFEMTTCRVSELAFRSIDATTCFERAVGLRHDAGVTAFEDLIKICLRVDPRLRSAPFHISHSDANELLSVFEKQIRRLIYNNQGALKGNWFREFETSTEGLCLHKYKKLTYDAKEKIVKVKLDRKIYLDPRKHYQVILTGNEDGVPTSRVVNVVLEPTAIVNDMFSERYTNKVFGTKKYLVLFMLAEALATNNECRVEGIGKQYGDQVKSNQGENAAEYRGCLSVNMDILETMKPLCRSLAKQYTGDEEWNIKPLPLPLKKASRSEEVSLTKSLISQMKRKGSKSLYLYDCLKEGFEKKAKSIANDY